MTTRDAFVHQHENDWNPRSERPIGIRFENLRNRGVDLVRINFEQSTPWLDLKRDGFLEACVIAALVAKPYAITFALAGLASAFHGYFLYHRRQRTETCEISIAPDLLTIVKTSTGSGPQPTWHLAFSEIEHIAIAPGRRGLKSTVNITTSGATIAIGAGQPDATLFWLENFLVMELVGLTWRPLHGIDRRYTRTRDMLITNPLLLKPDLASRLIEIFIEQAPDVVKKLGAALAAKSAEEVRQNADWLKSASANVGARHMSELCQLIEVHGREKDFERIDALFGEIERKCEEVIDWLNEIRGSAACHIAFQALDDETGKLSCREAGSRDSDDERTAFNGSGNAIEAPAIIEARVLVVDDSAVSRELAKDFLEEIVSDVVFAENGFAAIQLLKQEKFDLVLMDCEMVGLNGYKCTTQWRKHENLCGLRRIPIVATTAHALKGDRASCIAAGMDDYLCKPFSPEELRDKIEQWLSAIQEEPKDKEAPVVEEADARYPNELGERLPTGENGNPVATCT